jgi:beta-lactamase class A
MGHAVGWPTLHSYARSLGLSGTTLSPVNTTTATDIANLLMQLYNGQLINNPEHTNQLMGYMKSQTYRSGIPAGVPGTAVANKVGFNPGIWNDAAIVYGPKSTYVLVVLSNSGSSAIKDLSSRLAEFFNQ